MIVGDSEMFSTEQPSQAVYLQGNQIPRQGVKLQGSQAMLHLLYVTTESVIALTSIVQPSSWSELLVSHLPFHEAIQHLDPTHYQ